MKVYDRIVWNAAGEVIEEVSHEYDGEVSLCCGGSSGEIKFPDFMQDWLSYMLAGETFPVPNPLDVNVSELANLAWATGGNPYEGESPFDPDTQLSATQTELAVHDSLLAGLNQ